MFRTAHTIVGLSVGLVVCFLALTGAILSVAPAIDHMRHGNLTENNVTVGDLAAAVTAHGENVERIVRKADSAVIVYSSANGVKTATLIDPQTDASLGEYQPSAFFGFVIELHRSMFMGSSGRAAAGLTALAMAILIFSGALLLVARAGGLAKLFKRSQGTFSQRIHADAGRLGFIGMLITAITGFYMSLVSLGLVGSGVSDLMPFPQTVDSGPPAPISDLSALKAIPLADLRELVFPVAGDPTDAFTVTTRAGQGYVDQATGKMLSFAPNGMGQSLYETIYMLHTGEGLWWFGVILGVCALCIPVMAVTGVVIWLSRRKNHSVIAHNVSFQAADTIILVGSHGGATWGFAATLHKALTEAGFRVHTGSMNSLQPRYLRARQMFILTATHGDGDAPGSADRFLKRLDSGRESVPMAFAVLGFGDRGFERYRGFAANVESALLARGWPRLLELFAIDRQSSQSFADWGTLIGARIGANLRLEHATAAPAVTTLILSGRQDYGLEVKAPTSVFRFVGSGSKDPRSGRLPKYEAGDLIGIVPPGSSVPRYYSLASCTREGVVEICVRKQSGGLCSEFLHGLEPGATIAAFIQPNPDFRPARGCKPVIMIGSGAGIAPLIGFIRNNRHKRDIYLYWGGRHPQSDFLYEDSLNTALETSGLTKLVPSFSRIEDGSYVQDKLHDDAAAIRGLVKQGAQILVCGGAGMAHAVMQAVDQAISPLGIDVQDLKSKRRYLEDVY